MIRLTRDPQLPFVRDVDDGDSSVTSATDRVVTSTITGYSSQFAMLNVCYVLFFPTDVGSEQEVHLVRTNRLLMGFISCEEVMKLQCVVY